MVTESEQGLPIKEATARVYPLAVAGDSVNVGMPTSQTRRGRVGKQIANTLTTQQEMGTVTDDLQIRKLTTKECWRLQGFGVPIKDEQGNIIGWDDTLFEKAKAACVSDSQLYKQAGNAVSCNITYALALRIKFIEEMECEK